MRATSTNFSSINKGLDEGRKKKKKSGFCSSAHVSLSFLISCKWFPPCICIGVTGPEWRILLCNCQTNKCVPYCIIIRGWSGFETVSNRPLLHLLDCMNTSALYPSDVQLYQIVTATNADPSETPVCIHFHYVFSSHQVQFLCTLFLCPPYICIFPRTCGV